MNRIEAAVKIQRMYRRWNVKRPLITSSKNFQLCKNQSQLSLKQYDDFLTCQLGLTTNVNQSLCSLTFKETCVDHSSLLIDSCDETLIRWQKSLEIKCTDNFKLLGCIKSFCLQNSELIDQFKSIIKAFKERASDLSTYQRDFFIKTLNGIYDVVLLSEPIVEILKDGDRNRFIADYTGLKTEQGFTYNASNPKDLISYVVRPIFDSFKIATQNDSVTMFFRELFNGSDPCFNGRVMSINAYLSRQNDIPEDVSFNDTKDAELAFKFMVELMDFIDNEGISTLSKFYESNDAIDCFLRSKLSSNLAYSEEVILNSISQAKQSVLVMF
ncbi:MAG: hypothetical protein VW397_02675 [Candidatus Margulisiibacteriota bacterium]